jgi:hypothetical protein
VTRKDHRIELLFSIGAAITVLLSVVVGLAWENVGIVPPSDIGRALFILMPVAVLGPLLCALIYRPLVRIFPVFLFLLFAFKAVHGLLPEIPLRGEITLLALSAAGIALFLRLRKIEGIAVSRAIFGIFLAMAVATLLAAAPNLVSGDEITLDDSFFTEALARLPEGPPVAEPLPDIIYIVPDRYASGQTLLSEFGYDNSAFYDQLQGRGFLVDADAWANYPKTFQSLASTLNSSYLERLAEAYGPENADQRPVNRMLEDNHAQRSLRSLGYEFHNFGNFWQPTRTNKFADENFLGYADGDAPAYWQSEFQRILWLKTPFPELAEQFGKNAAARECQRIKRQLQRLANIGNGPDPVFAFAHLVLPHSPVLMDAGGACLERKVDYPAEDVSWPAFKAAYVEYLRFFNSAVSGIFDQQQQRRADGGRGLIFVIQSDEGPFPRAIREQGKNYDFFALSPADLKMKMGILNAVYLPGHPEREQYPPGLSLRTPINNWRIIFSHLTGADPEPLPDRLFIFQDKNHIYGFREVSHLLGGPSEE